MIKLLAPEVYQKIKAGEVIEDPASIVRELLDNSIDAKASQIIIDILDGGLEEISFKDNGIGMSDSDLKICFLEHSTSKITSFDDISHLSTNGFRGEALSSICRVAKVSILSGTEDSITSNKIFIEDYKISEHLEMPQFKGTAIVIKELFYNLPVRKKFLKSKTRESSKIKKEVIQKALSYPSISFKLISNGKTLIDCPANQTIKERIMLLLNIKEPLHNLLFEHPEVGIKGLVTGIDQVFDSSTELYIFINHRPLNSKNIYGVINRALSQLIPKHKYLGGCIYITTSSKNIDPNVHPAKKEMKISVEDIILRGLYTSLREIFYSTEYTTYIDLPQTPDSVPEQQKTNVQASLFLSQLSNPTKETTKKVSPNSIDNPNSITKPPTKSIEPTLRYIGTYNGTYWLVESPNGMILIDFHAAHERMRYEKLKIDLNNNAIDIQPLLVPTVHKLTEQEWDFLDNSKEIWESLGFDIELLSDFTIMLRAVPSFFKENPMEDISRFINEFDSPIFNKIDVYDKILKYAACRKSYMANDNVPLTEINFLLQQILDQAFPLTCPHGRPFIFILDNKTIESHFLR